MKAVWGMVLMSAVSVEPVLACGRLEALALG